MRAVRWLLGLALQPSGLHAAVALAQLAGFSPAGVLCELMNPDGSMMRGAELDAYAAQHDLPRLTVDELVRWLNRQA